MKPAIAAIEAAQKIVVIQVENPDADSLSSALAFEDLLGEQLNKEVSLYCPVQIPTYLRYLPGWDRVEDRLPPQFDVAIIVDASTKALLERLFTPEHNGRIEDATLIVVDHHATGIDLEHGNILAVTDESAVSTGQVIAEMAEMANWQLSPLASEMIASSILADSLGLTSPKTTAQSIHLLAQMVENGANLNRLDEKRRELSKKPEAIFRYKGRLFERVELHLDSQLATVVIPWEEIEAYSDQYNPSMLVIDEMRMIEGVAVAAAFKTYPDGKITCKLRANPQAQFMNELAEHFGGGGHPFAAGFKVYGTDLATLKQEFLATVNQLIESHKNT